MQARFFNEPEDCDWLRHVLPSTKDVTFKSFMLYGNEDCPIAADLFESDDPLFYDDFTRVAGEAFNLGDSGYFDRNHQWQDDLATCARDWYGMPTLQEEF